MISDPKGAVLGGKLSEEGGETAIRLEFIVFAIARSLRFTRTPCGLMQILTRIVSAIEIENFQVSL